MEDIKYMNLIEIGPVVIEIWGVENGELAVPVNNILVCHTAFLATDTQPCLLIKEKHLCSQEKFCSTLENREKHESLVQRIFPRLW